MNLRPIEATLLAAHQPSDQVNQEQSQEALTQKANNVIYSNFGEEEAIIKGYNLGEKDRLRLALKIIELDIDGFVIPNAITYFDLNDYNRYVVVGASLNQDVMYTMQCFQSFNITNQEWRFRLAQMVAHSSSWLLTQYLHRFELSDQQNDKIIKFVARINGAALSQTVEQLKLENENARYEIALAAIESVAKKACNTAKFDSLNESLEHLKNYNISLYHQYSVISLAHKIIGQYGFSTDRLTRV